jgi:putative two-component system response regulator
MTHTTILIVDDEPANLSLLAQVLQPHFQVRVANSGEHALNAVEIAPRPDLILLDVMMPGLDGYGVLARLRENPDTYDIPVIFVTALNDAINEEHGLTLGAVDFIGKPIKPAIVLARVRAQLELKQARDRLQNQNVWLEAEVTRRVNDALLVEEVSLAALAGLAEARDSDTGNHIFRTQTYVERLARRLQKDERYAHELSEQSLIQIVKAAPLHDIGKIGIPDYVLLKPDRLTPDEFEIIKGHSRIGGDTIRHAIDKACQRLDCRGGEGHPGALAYLEVAAVIATHHHERWDGAGYPDGLAGDAIPLPARLMAVADVFDALTTKRVYKEAMSIPEASAYIQQHSGSHFDPVVAGAFATCQTDIALIASRYADPAAIL